MSISTTVQEEITNQHHYLRSTKYAIEYAIEYENSSIFAIFFSTEFSNA